MKKLIQFLVKNVTGSDKFTISKESNGEQENYSIKADPEIIGIIIGRNGKTIKNIRKIVSIKAALDNKTVGVSISDS